MRSTARLSPRVSEQLLVMHVRNAARALLPVILAVALSYLLLRENVNASMLGVWALSAVAILIVRVVLLLWLKHTTRISVCSKPTIASFLSFCAGCAFSFSLIYFPEVALFERAMLTAIMLGVASGAISSNLGYQPLFLAYTLPILGSLGTLWIANPGNLVGGMLAACIGISVYLVALIHALMAQDVFNAFALSVESSTALEKRGEELAVALESTEIAKSRAEASSSSKTRFIAAASHDLRQPVHVLNLYSAALSSAELTQPVRTIVNDMSAAISSLSSQLNTLLDISELDGGRVEPRIEAVDLYTLARTLHTEFRTLADDKSIDLVNTVELPLYVESDPTMLAQVFRNLCSNAIKYTNSGSVTIIAEERGDGFALSIIDTGIGIDDGDTDKVFEEFYQASNPERDRTLGMGLGLSIVARLVRTLGHTIELTSTPGVGTRIGVIMTPSAHVPPAEASPASERIIPLPTLPEDFHVHLVDDDDAVRRSMQAMLEARHVTVTTSSSTQATLAFLNEQSPSALIVDLRLGESDSGLHIVDALAQSHPALPVALVSGEASLDKIDLDRYQSLLTLQKPVEMEDLLDVLSFMSKSVPVPSREVSA